MSEASASRRVDSVRHSKGAALSAIFAILLAAGGWFLWSRSHHVAIRSGACGGCNVLLITIDTLRVDRVGAFGGPGGLTPNLDRLASEGLRLTRAYSAAPLTLPSHTSILTGVSPPVHGVRANGIFRLGPRLPTLATIFKAAGYRTGAFIGAFVLDARFGLNRGFDEYDDRYGEQHAGDVTEGAERRAEDVVKPAKAWILNHPGGPVAGADQDRWFAWVHLYDPHEPYRAPEPYASRHQPYDAEVAYTDATVGAFLDDLRAAGQLDRTLVVIAGDHGESLGEHGERTHGVFAYQATLRVPWIIWAGARVPGRSFDSLARLIDLAPTTLDLVGAVPPPEMEGRSLLPMLAGDEAPASFAYFEAMDANLTRNWAPLAGVVASGYKLIDLPIPELYDLSRDPGESTNLYQSDRERVRTLESLLRETRTQFAAKSSASANVTLNAESRQRLQALGYVASSADPGHRVYTDADDPKSLIGPANDLNRAVDQFKSGARDQGMAAVGAIITEHPGFTTAIGMLASMQREMGDLPGAIRTLEDLVRRGIADQRVMVVLADYLQEAGDLDKSLGLLNAVILSHPDYAEAYNSLGLVESRLGHHDKARAAYHHLLELDPTSATAYENLALDELAGGELDAAISHLTHALDLDPRLAGAHNILAAAYMREGRPTEAISHWQAALQLNPLLFDALYNLGTALFDAGRVDEARPYLLRFVERAPPQRYGADIVKLRALLARSGSSR